jgi:lysophospholipase L1-like esterase
MIRSAFLVIPIFVLLLGMSAFAQDYYPYANQKYGFIRYDKNVISFPGDSLGFEKLFNKFDQVIQTGEGKITIVHIGGSHIQAGFYSGVVRKKMQTFFPGLNGGRGLVFPYQMSKTNNPKNYKVTWTGEWTTCSNMDNVDCELGLTGIAAFCKDPSAEIDVVFSENYVRYDFNSIKVFHKIGDPYYKIRPLGLDTSHYTVAEFPESGYSLITLDKYYSNLKLSLFQTDSIQKEFVLYGISFENDNPGIVYIDAGINGASVNSFLKCSLLGKQMETIKPDLVILSLGTNDTYTKNFRDDYYKLAYKQLIHTIKKAVPDVAFLITVPNDSYYRKRTPNENTALAEEAILQLAKEQSCGVWDFYQIMGGYNSSLLWLKEKLMHTDLIHFTKEGYQIKGELMFEAIIKAYDNHIEKNKASS